MKQSIFLLICLSMIITFMVPAHAAKVSTVEGIIQRVTNDSIQVRGKYYGISGIPLINPSGEHLKKTSLTSGKKVEIFFQEGKITSILIYEDMVE
ncbi:MAG: hypothetical protein C4560_02665 [Nitrospiraceae bacterium]|nr:MAG: hypothetical protein C4560_02665 [Nitrospiraceae bacterium]